MLVRKAQIYFSALLLLLIFRTALFQMFNVTSGSMEPTLLVGDYLIVSKYAYGFSRYSLPFSLPLFDSRVAASTPERGDIVVFRYPKDAKVDFVKRIVGLPGDKIEIVQDVLYINKAPVKRTFLDQIVGHGTNEGLRRQRWQETLSNGVSYITYKIAGGEFKPNSTGVYAVPPNHYFVIGDNRDDSRDSRDGADVGYIPFENLIGQAKFVFLSMKAGVRAWQVWHWPSAARFERFGVIVR